MLRFLFSNETNVAVTKAVFAKIVVIFEKTLAMRVRKVLCCGRGEIGLTLVDDGKMKFLNFKYREKNMPTDVLSFAYTGYVESNLIKTRMTKDKMIQVGDIFISVETARRQAKECGHGLKEELRVLFTHGLLHLFGFDHRNYKEEAEMQKWERRILDGR